MIKLMAFKKNYRYRFHNDQIVKNEKLQLISQLEDCRKKMVEMRNIIKKKDEALNSFEQRRITIEILIYKIEKLGQQMKHDKTKMNRIHKEDVEKYEREVYNLMNEIINMKFQLSKKGPIGINRNIESASLRVPHTKDEADHFPEQPTIEEEYIVTKKAASSSQHIKSKIAPLTSTRSNIFSNDPTNRIRPMTVHRLMNKNLTSPGIPDNNKLSGIFSKRSQSKPNIKNSYLPL